MKVDTIQTSFSGGEFGPSLYGRTDIVQYANACQLVENFLPRSYGSVVSMPGTRYVATVSDSTLNTRLIHFIFNRADSYVIEMGDLYMRFFTDRGQVINSSDGATEDLSGVGTPVSHWKCNDNTNSTVVIDAQGAHNGTLVSANTATVSTAGIVSNAFDLGGIYYIDAGDHSDFTRTASTQPMSFVGWFYYDSTPGGEQVLFSKWNTSSVQREYKCAVPSSAGQLKFHVFDETGNGLVTFSSDKYLSEGWNFVAVTFAGDGNSTSDCQIYLNGFAGSMERAVGSGSYSKMINTTAEFTIGATDIGGSRWNGKVDNFAFFHSKLTAAQVSSLYGSTPYQITTVFTEDEIFDVQFTQLNDIIWLAHPTHPPQKLIRTSADSWTISDAPIIGGPFLDDNTPAITSTNVSASSITITASATTGTVNLTVSPTNSSLFTVSGTTLGHHNSYWMLGSLAQTNATTGAQEVGYVRITHVINSYTATATVIKNIKSLASTVWAEGAWSAVRGYPARVVLHERRLWFARTNHEPQKEWASKIFEYENFALDAQADDDALNLPLASNESNEIQWLAPGKSLVAGTYGGAFVTNSGSTEPITPDNANASEEIGFGSEDIAPEKVGNFLYYIQRFGKKLRELFYTWELDTYKAVDRTILSPHILGDGVVDMSVGQSPESLLYCTLEDGTMAIMTREVDQDVTAWSRHSTNGTYTSIAVIPSQTASYDEAWVIVERWINGTQKKYVEYFENVELPEQQYDCLYLHSALTYDAYDATSTSSVTISLSASSGSVTLTASSAYFNGEMIGRRLRAIDEDGDTIGEGSITATGSTTSITLSITTTFNALSYSSGRWGVSVSTISGLTHLEAKTIGILADGVTESLTRSVASGVVTLGSNYFVIHAGLSYDQILYTLPKEAGTNRGTAQGKLQRINEIALKVNRSTQGFKYGTDASNLDDANVAFTPSVSTLYTGILPPQGGGLTMRGGYFRGAQVYIKNPNPLPMEILSIMAAVDTEEK